MKSLEFAAAVKECRRLYGTMAASTSPVWIREYAKTGADFVFIDTEHIPIDRAELAYMCVGCEAAGTAPLVRVPSYEPLEICKALDAGACGIMAPYTETVEQVISLIKAVKYRPLKGKALEDALFNKEGLTKETAAFIEGKNRDKALFLNIESVEAVNNLPQLLDFDEVDGVIIGPHDLSVNMGIPEQWGSPVYDDMIKRIIDITRGAGKSVGNHYSFGLEQEIKWAQCGMNIFLHSTDINAFVGHIKAELDAAKKALGDAGAATGDTIAI
ncbi:MAG: aldolase/citrate lyase family protein [Oscillospiraceae bacterium]|nr:aldolase/citrate lyase family protein [Oscillospiraceae bacterium]